MGHNQSIGPQPKAVGDFTGATAPAEATSETIAGRHGSTDGVVRSAFGGLAIVALGAGIMTGVIPFPDLRFAPTPPALPALEGVSTGLPSPPMSLPATPLPRGAAQAQADVPTAAEAPLPASAASPALASIEAQPQPLAEPRPQLLRPLQLSELATAIEGMRIPESDKERLRGQVAAGEIRMAWIVLSDWDAEDGDVVLVSAAGYSQQVRLYHRPTTLAVPYKPGAPVTLTGVVDGDNAGITPAVHMGDASLPLKLRLGQTVQVPTP